MADSETMSKTQGWIITACAVIAAGIFSWGSIAGGWLGMPDTIDRIDENLEDLLSVQTHRIFIVVPEERKISSSLNPRVFEIEIPPNAVVEPTAFEFDQRPVLALPAPLPSNYIFSGWSAAFGPENLELLKPFTARVQLESDEDPDNVKLLHWSVDNMVWESFPVSMEKNLLTGEDILTFSTTETGLYAIALKAIE